MLTAAIPNTSLEARNLLPSELRRVRSDNLFERGRLLIIEHAGADYLLRITRQGKLILTK